MDAIATVERRRRNLRIVFFGIIVATLPFYCAGLLLWGGSPQRNRPTPTARANATLALTTPAPLPTFTLFGQGQTIPPTFTSIFGGGQATFVVATQPPVILPPPVFPSATAFIFPTLTSAPTLTPVPSFTSIPLPTETSIPIPTNTIVPFPTDLPPPVFETPTETPSLTALPPDGGGG
ncbi:MAG: hypothetical protein SGI73_13220 [Chloroflexota bacterium]|nr:hypothetical protein [Chloroflexota bacterium]